MNSKVKYMMASTFRAPHPLEVELAVDQAQAWPGTHNGCLRRSSPEEEHHAFILATWRDIQDGKHVEDWLVCWRTSVAKMKQVESIQKIFWHAARAREQIGERFDCLYYSTVLRRRILNY